MRKPCVSLKFGPNHDFSEVMKTKKERSEERKT